MNIAPQKNHAPTRTRLCVRFSVRDWAVSCLLGGVLVFAVAAPADGQARKEGGRPQQAQHDNRMEQRSQQRAGDNRFAEPRQAEQRQAEQRQAEPRAGENRRVQQPQDQGRAEAYKRGRMTADERRDLRRQINEAGQAIYANPPRR